MSTAEDMAREEAQRNADVANETTYSCTCICNDGFGMNLSCPIHRPGVKSTTPSRYVQIDEDGNVARDDCGPSQEQWILKLVTRLAENREVYETAQLYRHSPMPFIPYHDLVRTVVEEASVLELYTALREALVVLDEVNGGKGLGVATYHAAQVARDALAHVNLSSRPQV